MPITQYMNVKGKVKAFLRKRRIIGLVSKNLKNITLDRYIHYLYKTDRINLFFILAFDWNNSYNAIYLNKGKYKIIDWVDINAQYEKYFIDVISHCYE